MKAKFNIVLTIFFVFSWFFFSIFGSWPVENSWQHFSVFWAVLYLVAIIALNIRLKK